MQLPDYNFLPAPLWLITVLHLITLTLHFIAMNFLVGGVIAVLWGKFTDRWSHPVVQKFVTLFPSAMAATVTLGVAPLLFLQLTFPRQTYSAAIVSGWFWLEVVMAVMIAYFLLYGASMSRTPGRGRRPIYLTVALALMLYVSVVYSSVFSMVERPAEIATLYAQNQCGLAFNPHIEEYLFRWLHMIFGAITVGGFFVGFVGKNNDEAFRVGRGFFLWGMVVTSAFGIGYLLSLGEALPKLMHTPAIWALTLGVILSAGSLHFFFTKRFAPAGAMLGVSMLTMVITRHYVRLISLEGVYDPSTVPVRPQWSVFVLFLLFFLIAIAVLWYMLRMFFAPGKKTS
ncbi:MAG: hypothetical protein HY851_08635 [candidate division Zixibacteria bacterium]|nr:hypothetical protein [candidate division Zixibacteria bacterium]